MKDFLSSVGIYVNMLYILEVGIQSFYHPHNDMVCIVKLRVFINTYKWNVGSYCPIDSVDYILYVVISVSRQVET